MRNKNILIEGDRVPSRIGPLSPALQSATITIALECFLCLCEAIIESYSCMGDSVEFV